MRKLVFMMVAFVAMTAKGFCQGAPENQSFAKKILNKMEFGITAGVNGSSFTNANFGTDPLLGFQAGLIVAYKFSPNFLVQEEFLYSTQGAKVTNGVLAGQEVKLTYASVPILFKYCTSGGFFIQTGPQAGFKVKEDIGGVTDGKFAKKVDFGMVGGFGFKSKIGLGVDARYIYGFQKVQETPLQALGDFKNNSIQASVFYNF